MTKVKFCDLYLVAQVDREGKILGVREKYFDEDSAVAARQEADEEFAPERQRSGTDWPLWRVIPAEVYLIEPQPQQAQAAVPPPPDSPSTPHP